MLDAAFPRLGASQRVTVLLKRVVFVLDYYLGFILQNNIIISISFQLRGIFKWCEHIIKQVTAHVETSMSNSLLYHARLCGDTFSENILLLSN